MKTEVLEIEVMLPQHKEYQEPPEGEKGKKEFFPSSTSVSDFSGLQNTTPSLGQFVMVILEN